MYRTTENLKPFALHVDAPPLLDIALGKVLFGAGVRRDKVLPPTSGGTLLDSTTAHTLAAGYFKGRSIETSTFALIPLHG